MEWTDQGIVLSARPHGESAAVVVLMTREHGRHAGLVHGGQSARRQADLETGTEVRVVWRGRGADSLGTWALEPVRHYAAGFLADSLRLAAVVSACSLVDVGMPEREPHPAVFDGLLALFSALEGQAWDAACILWEMALLREMGFGLDLERCALTGQKDDLAWVSPRTGRAVSRSAGEAWQGRLLPLPGFLGGRAELDRADIIQGLELTGYFLERHALASRDIPLPPARSRLFELCSGRSGAGTV
ncbi:MAG: DNA repair protein RecO [Pseudomonadota bacterium]|nr:DNA repair protein RecO [Pseudomonadota bacterium]